jgi:hypothetical protein
MSLLRISVETEFGPPGWRSGQNKVRRGAAGERRSTAVRDWIRDRIGTFRETDRAKIMRTAFDSHVDSVWGGDYRSKKVHSEAKIR